MATTVMTVLTSSLIISKQAPRISIDGWRDTADMLHWNTSAQPPLSEQSSKDTFIVPNIVGGMALLCNASYPIEWEFHRERWGGRSSMQISINHMRGSDPDNLNPLWYSSELRFAGGNKEITGNYTCQRYGQPDMATSVYIFWEGNSPPYLTLPQRHKDHRKVEINPAESKTFVLPCTVSRPDISVDLFKNKSESASEQIVLNPRNKSVRYDPKVGFVLTSLPDPYGTYECIVGDREEDDYLIFDVVNQTEPKPEFDNKVWANATFGFDQANFAFKCCSSSAKPPKVAVQLCNHPTLCKLKKHVLHRMEWRGKRIVNGSCTSVPIPTFRGIIGVIGGVVRCVGDNVDQIKEYFLPTLKNQKLDKNSSSLVPFFSWGEATPEDMMTITQFPKPIYYGETRTIHCAVSPYYFSQGLHWSIEYENTTTRLKANQTRIGRRHAFAFWEDGNDSMMKIFIEKGLKAVTCYAPEWNSTGWASKKLELKPIAPVKPILKNPESSTIYWKLGAVNKTLTCEFEGVPRPGVYWKKDGKNIFLDISHSNISTTLTFEWVKLGSEGTYTCNISNVGGSSLKTFVVHVSGPVNMVVVGAYIFAGLCLVGVAVGGYFAWTKMQVQKETMRRLANVAFKDVTDSQRPSPPVVPATLTFPNGSTMSSPPIAILPGTMGSDNNGFFGDSQTTGILYDYDTIPTINNGQTIAANDFGKYQKM